MHGFEFTQVDDLCFFSRNNYCYTTLQYSCGHKVFIVDLKLGKKNQELLVSVDKMG